MYDEKRQIRKFGLTFGLFLMAMGVVVLYWCSNDPKEIAQALQSTSWSTTTGRVTSSEVTRHTDTDAKSRHYYVWWNANIEYRYSVGDRSYTGNKITFGQIGDHDPDFATGIVQNYPEGQEITVYYDPDDPDWSALQPGFFPSQCVGLSIGLLVIAAGALVFWKIGLSRRPAPRG